MWGRLKASQLWEEGGSLSAAAFPHLLRTTKKDKTSGRSERKWKNPFSLRKKRKERKSAQKKDEGKATENSNFN